MELFSAQGYFLMISFWNLDPHLQLLRAQNEIKCSENTWKVSDAPYTEHLQLKIK